MTTKEFIVLLFASVILKSTVAQTNYVTNGSSSNWTTTTAWTPNGTPKIGTFPYDHVTINHTINRTVGTMSVTGGSTITIGPGGTLNLTGNLTSGNWGGGNTVTNQGTLSISGNYNMTGDDGLNNSGELTATNFTTSGAAGSNIINSGTFNIINAITINSTRSFNSTGGTINGSSLTLGSASATLNLGNTEVNITNNMSITGSSSFSSDATSVLNVGGNFNNTGSVSSSINGAINITGNLNNTGSSNLTFNNDVIVGGDVTASGSTRITVNGTLDIDGALTLGTSAYMNGIGVVRWITFTATGTSYLGCSGGTRFDSDGGTANTTPVANPLDLNACAAGTLPVELIEFSALSSERGNSISWTTASEVNNDYFELLSSNDGLIWTKLTAIQGKNTTYNISNYYYQDNSAMQGEVFYQLKIIATDGSYSYSNIILSSRNEHENIIHLFQNNDKLSIKLGATGENSISIFNLNGQKLLNVIQTTFAVNEVIDIPINTFKPGLYIITINNGVNSKVTKIFIEK